MCSQTYSVSSVCVCYDVIGFPSHRNDDSHGILSPHPHLGQGLPSASWSCRCRLSCTNIAASEYQSLRGAQLLRTVEAAAHVELAVHSDDCGTLPALEEWR